MAELNNGSAVAEADQQPGISRIVTHVLTGLLTADIAGAAARLAVPSVLSHSESTWRIAIEVKPIVVLSRVLFVLTVVTFLIWFFQARDNASWSSWRQRRARAWAFWGWVVPIADLWIPFQMMGGHLARASATQPTPQDCLAAWYLVDKLAGDQPVEIELGRWLRAPART